MKTQIEKIIPNIDTIKHLKNLDFPRLAGTEGERKAGDYIIKTLKEYNCDPTIQDFHFKKAKTLPKILLPLVIIFWGILSLLNILLFNNNLIISVLVLLVPAGVILTVLKFDYIMKKIFQSSQKKLKEIDTKIKNNTISSEDFIKSRNVIAELGPDDAENRILFTAHYDSISLKIPMKIMMLLGIIGALGIAIYSVAYFFNIFTHLFLNLNFILLLFPWFLILLIITLTSLCSLLISRIFRTNESHGIIDDGTGTAILLELVKFLQDKKLNSKFIFCFFSAEELGLFGSGHYFSNNPYEKGKLHVISIDMIGEKPPIAYIEGVNPLIKIPMDLEFNTQIKDIAKKLEVEIKGTNFLYPGSDFAHWLFDGHKVNWFINGSNVIHSKHDNLTNLNEELVSDAIKVIIGYLVEFTLSKG